MNKCKKCGRVISGKVGKPNKSGLCSNCFNEMRYKLEKEKAK